MNLFLYILLGLSKKGGGNRRVKMNKTDTKQHILEKGQTLFFPNGQSSKGLINTFVFDVVDYQRKTIDCDKSLLQFYEETGKLMNIKA